MIIIDLIFKTKFLNLLDSEMFYVITYHIVFAKLKNMISYIIYFK